MIEIKVNSIKIGDSVQVAKESTYGPPTESQLNEMLQCIWEGRLPPNIVPECEIYIATKGYWGHSIEKLLESAQKDGIEYYVINPDTKACIKLYGLTKSNKSHTITTPDI